MDPERWQVIGQIYYAALERDPDQRSVFLEAACRGDPQLIKEIESLLAQDVSASGGLLSSPAFERAPWLLAEPGAQQFIGLQIGFYRIESLPSPRMTGHRRLAWLDFPCNPAISE
jgi:hypothetical protein